MWRARLTQFKGAEEDHFKDDVYKMQYNKIRFFKKYKALFGQQQKLISYKGHSVQLLVDIS